MFFNVFSCMSYVLLANNSCGFENRTFPCVRPDSMVSGGKKTLFVASHFGKLPGLVNLQKTIEHGHL